MIALPAPANRRPACSTHALQAIRSIALPDNGAQLRNDDMILQTTMFHQATHVKVRGQHTSRPSRA